MTSQKQPAIAHYVLVSALSHWEDAVGRLELGRDLTANNPMFVKPIMFLCFDQLAQCGYPISIAAEFRDPSTHPGMDILDSRSFSQILAESLEAGWVARPSSSWTNYCTTPLGIGMIRESADLALDYRRMQQARRQLPVPSGLWTPFAGDRRFEDLGIGSVVEWVVRGLVGADAHDVRSVLITRAIQIALETCYVPHYSLHESYHAVADKSKGRSAARAARSS